MKLKSLLLAATLVAVLCQAVQGHYYAAWFLAFVGSAGAITIPELQLAGGFCGAPTMVATLPVTHEDLSDVCVLLDAENTIFTSVLPKGEPPKDTVYRAPLDKLDNPRLGGLKEHQVVDRSKVSNRQANRKQVHGAVQHFRETYGASLIAEVVKNPAGIDDIIADGKAKTILALKRNSELTFLSEQDQNEIGSANAGLTRGAIAWCNSNAQPNAELAVPVGYRPEAAQNVAVAGVTSITEALFRTMMLDLRKARQQKIDVMAFVTLDAAAQFDMFFREQIPVAGSAVPVRSFQHDPDVDAYEEMITTYRTRFGKVSVNETDYLNGVRDMAPGLTGDATNGSPVITGLLNVPLDPDGNTALLPFVPIKGTGIPAGAYIVSVDSATQITISANCTANGADIALTLGTQTHMFFTDLAFWEQKPNMIPAHVELTPDGGGKDGYCEMMNSLFCTYPALLGRFFTA